MTAQLPRVVIADNDALARRAMIAELERCGRFADVVETTNLDAIMILAAAEDVTAIVLEPRVCGGKLERVIRAIESVESPPHVLLFAADADPDVAVSALRAGASGFVPKTEGAAALVPALETVLGGEVVMPGVVALRAIETLRDAAELGGVRPVVSTLTPREWVILDIMSAGGSTADIAEELVISTHTVYSHIKNLMRKLDVHSREEAVRAANQARKAEGRPPGGR